MPAVTEPAVAAAAEPAVTEPEAVGVTSAPLQEEPWAGLTPPPEPAPDPAPAPGAARPVVAEGGGEHARAERAYPAGLAWALTGLALVLVVLLAVAVAVRAADVHRHSHDDATRAAVLSAAVRSVPPLLSYNYSTIGGQAKLVDPHLTAAYRAKYDTSLQQVVTSLVVANKAVLTTTVITDSSGPAAAIRSLSGHRASVLVFINQTSTNNKRTTTRLEQTPVVLSMLEVNGAWLVDDLVTDAASALPTAPTASPTAGTTASPTASPTAGPSGSSSTGG